MQILKQRKEDGRMSRKMKEWMDGGWTDGMGCLVLAVAWLGY